MLLSEHKASTWSDGEGAAAMVKSASLVLASMGKRCNLGKGAEK